MPVTGAELKPFLEDDEVAVDRVLRRVQGFTDSLMTLNALRSTVDITGTPLEDLLADFLNDENLGWDFMYHLSRPTEPINDANFDLEDLGDFAHKMLGFKLYVFDEGGFCGIATLISHRLALTAWHVTVKDKQKERRTGLTVRTEEGHKTLRVLGVRFEMPCHDDQWDVGLQDGDILRAHPDVALLALEQPMTAYCELPANPPRWVTGRRKLCLSHRQDDNGRGITFVTGRATIDDPPRIQLEWEDGVTRPGSSGGSVFDTDLAFAGFHQGQLNGVSEIVPYATFAGIDAFLQAIAEDRAPPFIFSLTGRVDGHLIIGRQRYCHAIHDVASGAAPHLRGIWIKRMEIDQTTGLEFSYDLLCQVLAQNGQAAQVFRVELSLGMEDLLETLNERLHGGTPLMARPGAADDETSEGASDKDRARQLVDRLAKAAGATEDKPGWIYFDNPRGGLRKAAQQQLELLLAMILSDTRLRFVMAGGETYSVPGPKAENASALTAPGVMVDYIGQFDREDVRYTLEAINRSLGLGLKVDAVNNVLDQALHGVESQGTVYRSSEVKTVSENLRRFLADKLPPEGASAP
ncbi:serine protease [Roseibium sp. FZY0029]|uniref:trypsin-like serine peptidase n=1 Tax=Roseibium sp. FZY0029 TaxID=3116647 RepID=UPI002EAD7794|nr:serine protease [Roseibium sp. FZY0029]